MMALDRIAGAALIALLSLAAHDASAQIQNLEAVKDGMPTPAADAKHDRWIELNSMSLNQTTPTAARDPHKQWVEIQSLSSPLTRSTDAAGGGLASLSSLGSIGSIDALARGDNGAASPPSGLAATTAPRAAGDVLPSESFSFNYAKIDTSYGQSAGPGPGGGPHIKVFDGAAAARTASRPIYSNSFTAIPSAKVQPQATSLRTR